MADDIRNCADLDEHFTPYVDGEEGLEASRAVDIIGAAIADAAAGRVNAEEVARYAGW